MAKILGISGTLLAQTAWLPVLKSLGVNLWVGGALQASRAHTLFDAQGQLVDEAIAKRLASFVAGFAEFSQRAHQ